MKTKYKVLETARTRQTVCDIKTGSELWLLTVLVPNNSLPQRQTSYSLKGK